MPDSGESPRENAGTAQNGGSQQPAPAKEKAAGQAPPAGEPKSQPAASEQAVTDAELDSLLARAVSQPAHKQVEPPPEGAKPFQFKDVKPADTREQERNIQMLMDVNLNLRVELGRRTMHIEDILRLGQGSVVELDKLAGDPLDILVNDRLVARGEVLVLNDNFCIRVTSIVSSEENRPS